MGAVDFSHRSGPELFSVMIYMRKEIINSFYVLSKATRKRIFIKGLGANVDM